MAEYSRYRWGTEAASTRTGYVWMDIDVDLACKTNGWDLAIAVAMDIVD